MMYERACNKYEVLSNHRQQEQCCTIPSQITQLSICKTPLTSVSEFKDALTERALKPSTLVHNEKIEMKPSCEQMNLYKI